MIICKNCGIEIRTATKSELKPFRIWGYKSDYVHVLSLPKSKKVRPCTNPEPSKNNDTTKLFQKE